MGRTAAFVPCVGYRYAKVGALEIEGQPVYNANGSDYSVDYSGVFTSAGFRFFFGDQ